MNSDVQETGHQYCKEHLLWALKPTNNMTPSSEPVSSSVGFGKAVAVIVACVRQLACKPTRFRVMGLRFRSTQDWVLEMWAIVHVLDNVPKLLKPIGKGTYLYRSRYNDR